MAAGCCFIVRPFLAKALDHSKRALWLRSDVLNVTVAGQRRIRTGFPRWLTAELQRWNHPRVLIGCRPETPAACSVRPTCQYVNAEPSHRDKSTSIGRSPFTRKSLQIPDYNWDVSVNL